jgi:drug/metabolite transporter (DMT)-like permease
MIWIIGSIVLSSLLVASFKFFEKFQVNVKSAITLNYMTAALLGVWFSKKNSFGASILTAEWLPYTLAFGLMFIAVFNLISVGVKKSGLVSVSIAQKMSLVIPMGFSIIAYHESIGVMKIIGIVLALISIYFASYSGVKEKGNSSKLFIPLLIFIGSGLVDVAIKFSQERFGNEYGFEIILCFIFGSAGLIGVFQTILERRWNISFKDLLGGVVLGILNFSSTYVLMTALASNALDSSSLFAVNNIGIILFNALLASVFFKEKLGRVNYIGIALSVLAIVIIYMSSINGLVQ